MIIKIDFESEIPIYEQLKRSIIEGMAAGDLKPGESLPSVRQMAQDIGINLHTVNKAYSILKSDGYLNIDRRTGAVVNESYPKDNENFDEKLVRELSYLLAEAYLRDNKLEDILKLCSSIYKKYNVKNK
ncbi:GntR family transcriptional regulator [Clostridium luticellarii]|jgi:GntR family transcriptional regulator|uniref:HTH-type transcriptional repressor YtrA n=1 Tax=Clostridium luticellarii TaxID=1691940 RepID=A0A2T0BSG0_9CLOT|nr:GntR family transcriptional regulator [Clostridium luticellarii]MCI1945630.1 GntR family transcriptional regulator [Clostridium luticellarii]MCI1968447.1 GntR family transcriptional regulator [Clostridium luticellarii]MCI1996536.1 GntR family transcriptional regulator [Clostridium luticellarii]MCI2039841.1 GntR family transcriptional regulator [Clostridium luticellarii]PRR86838.1 HTH-type transcriptional repressor YtrA [Clostridium luticellarii]